MPRVARSRREAEVDGQSSLSEDVACQPKDTAKHHEDIWQAPFIASQAVVMDMVELYFEIVYPIFPFFHQPSFMRRISRGQYTTDRALFAATMAVCALISSRIRDGSVTNPKWDLDALRRPSPEVFYREAKRQLSTFDMSAALNVLRGHAIMAITAIQNGNIREMRWHLGTYQTLVSVDGLHDESNWPGGIGVIEREERRRL
ncbi:MAG: fungal specific transcription factor domain-containing protein, partial [Candidatus Binatia bacterium]